jgi:hypothetical protein
MPGLGPGIHAFVLERCTERAGSAQPFQYPYLSRYDVSS